MWGEFACLVLGATLVFGGLYARNFYAGLSSRVSIPAWQGRIWIVATGAIIALTGLGRMLGTSHSMAGHFVGTASAVFDLVYEFIGGIIAVLVGLVFLLAGKGKVDRAARLLGVAGLFFGFVLIADAFWKIRK